MRRQALQCNRDGKIGHEGQLNSNDRSNIDEKTEVKQEDWHLIRSPKYQPVDRKLDIALARTENKASRDDVGLASLESIDDTRLRKVHGLEKGHRRPVSNKYKPGIDSPSCSNNKYSNDGAKYVNEGNIQMNQSPWS